jgi:hypothetical protein
MAITVCIAYLAKLDDPPRPLAGRHGQQASTSALLEKYAVNLKKRPFNDKHFRTMDKEMARPHSTMGISPLSVRKFPETLFVPAPSALL